MRQFQFFRKFKEVKGIVSILLNFKIHWTLSYNLCRANNFILIIKNNNFFLYNSSFYILDPWGRLSGQLPQLSPLPGSIKCISRFDLWLIVKFPAVTSSNESFRIIIYGQLVQLTIICLATRLPLRFYLWTGRHTGVILSRSFTTPTGLGLWQCAMFIKKAERPPI